MKDWLVVCAQSGRKVWASETVVTWNGQRVFWKYADKRNPQDFVRAIPDFQGVPNARPPGTPSYLTDYLEDENGVPITYGGGINIIVSTTTVTV